MQTLAKALALSTLLAGSPVVAQANWPTKPIRLVVPTAAGSPIDYLSRSVAQQVQAKTGQSVVVENRPGANQIIGMDACARAVPDGYTFCIANNNSWTVNPLTYSKLPYDPDKQLTPVAILAWSAAVVTVTSELGAKNVEQVVTLSKQSKDGLNWGSTGNGSNSHLHYEAITSATGWKVAHVPYSNVGQLVPAALANTIQLYYGTIGSVQQYINEGRLIPLMVVSKERSRFLPDTPTLKEAGLGDFHLPTWFGLVAPKQTPPEVLEKMNKLVNEILQESSFKTGVLDPQTLEAGGGSVQDFANYLVQDRKVTEALVKKANIRLD